MYLFQNDYNKMCHPKVLEKLNQTAQCGMIGYGMDESCDRAAALIRGLCGREDVAVHFLSGGTQTNLTVIAAALRPHQAVVAPISAHISEHETGAIEATGHKVICLPHTDGKITAQQIDDLVRDHFRGDGPGSEHMPQPKLVYASFPTEWGTLYSCDELEAISHVCRQWGLYLYIDGARLGYGLTAAGNDVSMTDLARIADAFYIGGTKQGTMFGEAVVITNPAINDDFRYIIKQRGGMLAKGWLIGRQFEAMFEDGLYFTSAAGANILADKIRKTIVDLGYPMPVCSTTNQVFATMPDTMLNRLSEQFLFTEWSRSDETHRTVRFCTSWSTTQEEVELLCNELVRLAK